MKFCNGFASFLYIRNYLLICLIPFSGHSQKLPIFVSCTHIWDPLARVFDAWGLDRCLWGTDWTRAFAVVNYEQAVEPFRLTEHLTESERATLMGGACARAYGWAPEKR